MSPADSGLCSYIRLAPVRWSAGRVPLRGRGSRRMDRGQGPAPHPLLRAAEGCEGSGSCEDHLDNLRPLPCEGRMRVRGCSGEMTVFPCRCVGALLCRMHAGPCFCSPGNKHVLNHGHTNHPRASESGAKGPCGHTETSVSLSSMSR